MKRITTTKQINEVLSNNLLQVTKAEIYYKTSHKTDVITDFFLEDMQFFCESGCFMDRVGWRYEKDCTTGGYVIETGRKDGDSDCIIIAHLYVNENTDTEEIERTLTIDEMEE